MPKTNAQAGRVIKILRETGAIITNSHFVYTSGKHGPVYINKDAIYPHTCQIATICSFIAEKYQGKGIQAVAGPALGGIILSQWTAYHLSRLEKHEVLGVYTEKTEDNGQIFRRGYDRLIEGKRVLVVEDLTTTGGSAKKVVEATRRHGGKVVGVCVMVNRDPKGVTGATMGASFSALAEFPAEAFDPQDCPLCRKGVPINTAVGHGEKFLVFRENR